MTMVLQLQDAATASVVRRAFDMLDALAVQVVFYGEMPSVVPALGTTLILITISLEGWRKQKRK